MPSQPIPQNQNHMNFPFCVPTVLCAIAHCLSLTTGKQTSCRARRGRPGGGRDSRAPCSARSQLVSASLCAQTAAPRHRLECHLDSQEAVAYVCLFGKHASSGPVRRVPCGVDEGLTVPSVTLYTAFASWASQVGSIPKRNE